MRGENSTGTSGKKLTAMTTEAKMFGCKCLNILAKLEEQTAGHLQSFLNDSQKPANAAVVATAEQFFKKALGPVRCSNVQVKHDWLLRKERINNQWETNQCLNCNSIVFALHVADDANTDVTASAMITCLINSTLLTNEEQLHAIMSGENYSPAFGIVLDGSILSNIDLIEKEKLLSKAHKDNQVMQLLWIYTERETKAYNERIRRLNEQQRQESTLLKLKKGRAEQDCMVLAMMTPARPVPSSKGTNRHDSSANNQLETPPPTPERMPMSIGNSPPSSLSSSANVPMANNWQQPITPPSSSTMGDQSSFSASSLANNHINNNASCSDSRGAINRPQPQQPAATMLQQSSTTSYETDCMFDIEDLDNVNPLLLNSPSPSDENNFGFGESVGHSCSSGESFEGFLWCSGRMKGCKPTSWGRRNKP